MQLFPKAVSTPSCFSRLSTLFIITSSVCFLYLASLFLVGTNLGSNQLPPQDQVSAPTELRHIAFGIASSKKSWPDGKDYVATWWKADHMRGCVFLDANLPSEQRHLETDPSLPPVCISKDASRFRYSHPARERDAIRVSRIVSEIVALNLSDVRWFVFGEEDTVFFTENLAKTLSKYDHELWYYIGTYSESHEMNVFFGFGMAFSGAGFAISYSLAKVLAKVFDSCIERYEHLFGSDSRVYSCVAELGIGLTREPGFHQVDLRGDMFGLLASHPMTPLVSLHRLDSIDPIFPNKTSPKEALQHLLKASDVDSQRILQQTVCYDRWYSWTIIVSWGYAVQIYGYHLHLPDLFHVTQTFRKWSQRDTALSAVHTFNTKEPHLDPCQRPTVFFLESVTSSEQSGIETTYRKSFLNCSYDDNSPKKLDVIKVFSQKMDLDIKQLKAPRRHCCDVLSSSARNVMRVAIRECMEEELIYIHP